MKKLITTAGTAAVIGFAGLGLAAGANAAPASTILPTGSLTIVGDLALSTGSGVDARSDNYRLKMERERTNGYTRLP